MRVIEFNEVEYPYFQCTGNASRFAIPFAKEVCIGRGVDIGFNREEWKFPGAIGVDIEDTSNEYHALDLPHALDYIYSSHCLEHLDCWVTAMDYWLSHLTKEGVLFLYLPDFSQEYWRPWHNRKHKHVLTPEIIEAYLKDTGVERYFISDVDLNNSFMVIAEKG